MISYLKGTVLTKKERFVILLLHKDIGYRVFLTRQTLEQLPINSAVEAFIHTHVREDALELYGFLTLEELDFFERLIGISGVGPKSAMEVLSVAPLVDIKKAIVHGDPALLQKVAGIGKKTAERIIVDLKEKIAFAGDQEPDRDLTNNLNILRALSALGYRETEIRHAIGKISSENKELSEQIKEALKILSRPI